MSALRVQSPEKRFHEAPALEIPSIQSAMKNGGSLWANQVRR